MATPSIDYREVIQAFSRAQDQGFYICHPSASSSLTTTADKQKSVSLEEVTSLAHVAIEGLKKQRVDKSESYDKLQMKAIAVRDYLAKVKNTSSADSTHKIFSDIFIEVETEIKELAALDDSLAVEDFKVFTDNELINIADYPNHASRLEAYGINRKETKIRLAKLAAIRNGEQTAMDIHNYGIKDPKILIDIAKLAVQHDGCSASEYIHNFGIENEKDLIEIAKIAARRDGQGLSYHIKRYGITDQKALIEIAKLAAQNSGRGTSCYILNYNIKDPNVLIEIAKLAAQQDGGGTSENIENYSIKDPNALIDIAKLAAQQDGAVTSRNIHYYAIKDHSALVEIAKIATQKSVGGFVSHMNNYGFTDRQDLIDIAKTIAQHNGGGISQYIYEFGIKDKKVLAEIAKLAAQENGPNTSFFIKNYGIEEQSDLVDIAKIAATQNGSETLSTIGNYGIKDEVDRLEIFLIAFKKEPAESIEQIGYYPSFYPKELKKVNENSSLSDIQKAFSWPLEFSPIFKELSNKTITKEDINFLIYVGCRFLQKKSPNLKNLNVWSSILNYKDNRMRLDLVDMMFALDEKQAKIYSESFASTHLQLPALFFCFSCQNEEDVKGYQNILAERKEFHDGKFLKALLDALQPLIVQHQFKPQEIIHLLKKTFIGNIRANLFSIQGILQCGGVDELRNEVKKDKPDLGTVYQTVFARVIPMKHVQDFLVKYEQTFGRCALPSAPLTYAGRLRSLPVADQKKALSALGTFIYSVVEGTYSKNRYQKSQPIGESESKVSASKDQVRIIDSESSENESDHLQIIFKNKPSLQKDWPTEIDKVPLENYLTTPGKISFDPRNFLNDTIIGQKHLSREKHPLLFEYLENKDPGKEKAFMENFQKLLKEIAGRKKDEVAQNIYLRNALSSLIELEKKDKIMEKEVEKPEDIAKRNKIKAGRLLRVLTTAKKQLEGLHEVSESLKDIEKLDSSDPNYLNHVQNYVDRFRKAGTSPTTTVTTDDEEQQKLLLLQKDIIDLYRSEAPLKQLLNQLIKIQGKLGASREEFVNDVEGMIKVLQMQNQTYEDYTLTNTDRFDLMLLCGTQIQGSCQRIDGDPKYNKCLLAYLLDGKNRLIAIKDKEGNIVARSILRLLWDTNKKCPVLMQEKVYKNILDESLEEALNAFAKAQAERLGVDCYKPDEEGTASLRSFSSVAPWEYVDSTNGVEVNGQFTVVKASKT